MEEAGEIGLSQISWLLFIVVPFTPLILEMFGFYRNMMRKTVAESLLQMFRCLILLGVAVAVMVVFFQVTTSSRLVLSTAFAVSAVLLLLRDVVVRQSLKRAARVDGGRREKVVIAGASSDMEAVSYTHLTLPTILLV